MVVMGMFVRLILHFMTKHCNAECHGIVQAQGLAELAFDLLYVEMLLTTVVDKYRNKLLRQHASPE